MSIEIIPLLVPHNEGVLLTATSLSSQQVANNGALGVCFTN